MTSTKTINGFTLVELSIVIVIIGLIVSAVTAGSSLIKSTKIKMSVNQIEKFRMIINTFQAQYNALPGDITNASSYWPGCDPTPANCNGNGDGYIAHWDTQAEGYRAWQQLVAAKLLEGGYTGTGVAPNTPTLYFGDQPGGVAFYDDTYWNAWSRMKALAVTSMLPTITYNLDKKYDDGLPGKGDIISYSFTAGMCTQNIINAGYNRNTETYIPSMASGSYCAITFRNMYGSGKRQVD